MERNKNERGEQNEREREPLSDPIEVSPEESSAVDLWPFGANPGVRFNRE